ncbi:MAG: hypothetical protein WCK11_03275, partial [Candidatus Falkowbacteria bacterium]
VAAPEKTVAAPEKTVAAPEKTVAAPVVENLSPELKAQVESINKHMKGYGYSASRFESLIKKPQTTAEGFAEYLKLLQKGKGSVIIKEIEKLFATVRNTTLPRSDINSALVEIAGMAKNSEDTGILNGRKSVYVPGVLTGK